MMNEPVPLSPTPAPSLGAGFRFSTYGAPGSIVPEYWAGVGQTMAGKFAGAHPETIWIVGNLYNEGVYLNFPCKPADLLIACAYADMNEAALSLFDEQGFQVWLQVEPGNADVEELIGIVLQHYRHHPSVVGFGVDVEWYRSTTGPEGQPVTDAEAQRWVDAVRAVDPAYRLFLKHWEADWMPPMYREGLVFVDDSQQFESLDALVEEFTGWGERFAPAPVAFQYGYPADRKWWGELADPAGEIGQAVLARTPNTQALFWVDFTVKEVFPME